MFWELCFLLNFGCCVIWICVICFFYVCRCLHYWCFTSVGISVSIGFAIWCVLFIWTVFGSVDFEIRTSFKIIRCSWIQCFMLVFLCTLGCASCFYFGYWSFYVCLVYLWVLLDVLFVYCFASSCFITCLDSAFCHFLDLDVRDMLCFYFGACFVYCFGWLCKCLRCCWYFWGFGSSWCFGFMFFLDLFEFVVFFVFVFRLCCSFWFVCTFGLCRLLYLLVFV